MASWHFDRVHEAWDLCPEHISRVIFRLFPIVFGEEHAHRSCVIGGTSCPKDSNDLNETDHHHHVVRFRISGQCSGFSISRNGRARPSDRGCLLPISPGLV